MYFVELLNSLSLTDVILISSAALFFTTVGAYAGLLRKRSIVWSCVLAIALCGVVYQEEIYFQWLLFKSNQ